MDKSMNYGLVLFEGYDIKWYVVLLWSTLIIIVQMLIRILKKCSATHHLLKIHTNHYYFSNDKDKPQSPISTQSNSKTQSSQSTQQKTIQEMQKQQGTQYSNWVLARSANFNHNVSYLKRRYGRDRYNIHKLTNIDFMCSLVNRQDKYSLNLNEKIVLLAQLNHVCNVLKKDKTIYAQFSTLISKIMAGIADPQDYICLGTFLNVLVDLGNLSQANWIDLMDALFIKKYDQQFDQLFGIYCGLYKYKRSIQQTSDYFQLQRNKIIYNIPIVYRNSLQVIRQYVKYNIYNLKQCRILFRSLYNSNISDMYFWRSVGDWFGIYIKQQLSGKEMEEFFIVAESAVDRILYDDGMIRPRSVLEEIAEIAFILSQYKIYSDRFIGFIQRLIVYSIQNGGNIFNKFLDIQRKQSMNGGGNALNEHMRTARKSQEDNIKKMEKKYKTIFVNPTEVSSQAVVQLLIVIKRIIAPDQEDLKEKKQEKGDKNEQNTQQTKNKQAQQARKRHNQRKALDMRVLSWLVMKLCQPKMRYTVNQLLKVIQCRKLLSSLRVNILGLITQKLQNVRQKQCSLQDVKDILYFLPLLSFQKISYILQYFLSRAHPKDILELTRLIERQSISQEDYQFWQDTGSRAASGIDRSHLLPKQKNKRWMPYLIKYFLALPGAVNMHERYYSFQENCYFLYLVLKNEQYWQSSIGYQYLGEIEKLKCSIKIASDSRGVKLQMGTYFYKLMDYVDVVAFFDGG